jgi:hypothetical protein
MKQTLRQWQGLRHGQTYNHDSRHFKFDRTCSGFHPEPDALPIDRIIAVGCIIALVGLIVISLI